MVGGHLQPRVRADNCRSVTSSIVVTGLYVPAGEWYSGVGAYANVPLAYMAIFVSVAYTIYNIFIEVQTTNEIYILFV